LLEALTILIGGNSKEPEQVVVKGPYTSGEERLLRKKFKVILV